MFHLFRSLTPLEELLEHRFRKPELLQQALTHRSHANEQGRAENYERLEFLGDGVLGALTAEWLCERFPTLPEGELSKLKAALVSEPSLAEHAQRLGLGERLRLGVGEERSGGRKKPSLLADALEALLGALWLDGGVEAARGPVRRLLEASVAARQDLPQLDYKTRLQELVQAKGWARPSYRIVEEIGPDHDKTFVVECLIQDEVKGRGEGRSKKAAEQDAAAKGLNALESSPNPVASAI